MSKSPYSALMLLTSAVLSKQADSIKEEAIEYACTVALDTLIAYVKHAEMQEILFQHMDLIMATLDLYASGHTTDPQEASRLLQSIRLKQEDRAFIQQQRQIEDFVRRLIVRYQQNE